MFYKGILILVLNLGFVLSSFAQGSLKGKIIDDYGESVIGGTVLIVGTTTGTATDFDGNYLLEGIPSGTVTIQVSYTGYENQEFTIEMTDGAELVRDVTMGVDVSVLEEIVVIGYGTVKKEDATGSVQTVNSDQFNQGAITGAQELVAGKIAGVQITTNSGAPGDGAQIRIRGGSSLSASNDPLIVVDGIPIDNGELAGSRNTLNFINPSDIATFTVLKDASATAIYGSRASNGVILITTKKGKLGKKIRVNYSGNFSTSSVNDQINVLNGDEYRSLINDRFESDHPAVALLGNANTNWQDEIYESAIGFDHNLSLSGGIGDFLPYRLALGLTDKNGVLKTDEFKRKTVALNLSPGFLDNSLQVNVNLKGMFIDNNFANRDAIGAAVGFDPTQPILDDNNFGGYYAWVNPENGNPNNLAPSNPLALLNQKIDQASVNRFLANASIDYRLPFLPGLRANLNLGYDIANGEGTTDVDSIAAFNFNDVTGGGVDNEYDETKKNELIEFYLNYGKTFGDHKVELMGGYSWQHFFNEKYERNSDVRGNAQNTVIKESKNELYLLSLFGRANYTLMDKYLFTFTLRRDASSRFSPENRWGLFPAAAFAYKVINKEVGTLTNLKLRVGYGVTGQQDIGDFYEHLPRYLISTDNARYQFGDELINTLRPEGYDSEIKWEETTTYNIGVDYGFLDNRIYGSLEYYIRKTKDLLNFIPVAAGTNLTNFIDTNVGDLENEGVEFSINAIPVKKANVLWEVGFNVTRNTNEITRLTATDDPDYQGVLVGGISGGVGSNIQIHSVGFPASSYFVYEQVYDADNNPIEGLYVDKNGDGKISPDDQYRFEKPAPDYFFGFTSSLDVGKFNFSMAGRANLGNYVYNNIQSNLADYGRLFHPSLYIQNATTDITKINFEGPDYFSDHFVQDGSFFRIDYVSLSYALTDLFKKKNSITLSATLQNPLLITNYTGLDPEITDGIDNNIYPRVRTFVFGVNANF